MCWNKFQDILINLKELYCNTFKTIFFNNKIYNLSTCFISHRTAFLKTLGNLFQLPFGKWMLECFFTVTPYKWRLKREVTHTHTHINLMQSIYKLGFLEQKSMGHNFLTIQHWKSEREKAWESVERVNEKPRQIRDPH